MVPHRLQLRPVKPSDHFTIYNNCIRHSEYLWAQRHYLSDPISNSKSAFNYIAELTNTTTKVGHITGYIREVYRCVWIQTLMIYPDYVRQNYGTELYLKTIKLLSTYYHLDKVRLTVIDANKTAHAFWLSLDFKALFKFNKKIDNKNVSVTIYEKNIIEDYKGGPYE